MILVNRTRLLLFWALLTVGGTGALYRDLEKRILEAFNELFPMENKNLIEGDIVPDDEASLSYNAITSDSK